MKKFLSFLLVLFFISCCHTLPSNLFDISSDYSGLYSSVGKIGLYATVGKDKILVNSGSGFAIEDHLILTVEHLCEDIDSGRSIYLSYLDKGKETLLDEELIPIKRSKDYDLCLLSIKDNPLKPIRFSKNKPKMGDKIFLFGVHKGFAYLITEGFYGNEVEAKIEGVRHSVAVLSIQSAPGSSGGPVLNEKGEFVTILKAVYLPIYFISSGPTYENVKKFLEK